MAKNATGVGKTNSHLFERYKPDLFARLFLYGKTLADIYLKQLNQPMKKKMTLSTQYSTCS